MILKHFKISDTDRTVLYLSDFLNVWLRNDNLQSFDAKWDETIIAMRQHPDEEVLESLYFRQLDKSGRLKQLVALCIQDAVQKAELWN